MLRENGYGNVLVSYGGNGMLGENGKGDVMAFCNCNGILGDNSNGNVIAWYCTGMLEDYGNCMLGDKIKGKVKVC